MTRAQFTDYRLTVKGVPFPSLRDASVDDLKDGLESGLFTSLELTQVGHCDIALLGLVVSSMVLTNYGRHTLLASSRRTMSFMLLRR